MCTGGPAPVSTQIFQKLAEKLIELIEKRKESYSDTRNFVRTKLSWKPKFLLSLKHIHRVGTFEGSQNKEKNGYNTG